MNKYRVSLMLCVNVIMIFWFLVGVNSQSKSVDFLGFAYLFAFSFLCIYNIYLLILYKLVFKGLNTNFYVEIIFTILVLLPFFLLR